MFRFILLFLCLSISNSYSQDSISINLKKIQHLSPIGRVQDKEYNPNIPVIDTIISLGTSSIQFLVSKLVDKTIVSAGNQNSICDYWDTVRVGDVAYFILCDLFTTPDWQHSTIQPALSEIFRDNSLDSLPSYLAWKKTVNKYGRKGIKLKMEAVLKPYYEKLIWDKKELCFRPKSN